MTRLHRRAALRLLGGTAATGALSLTLPGGRAVADTPAKRPNIVVILADDMGYSDIGCFGSEIPTPNLDALAAGGIRFTQFYNNARCSPSRAALITGAYSHQAGFGHLQGYNPPGAVGMLSRIADRVVTFGEVMGPAGYLTSAVGKWHLGIPKGTGPWQRGFTHSMVAPAGEIYYPEQPQPITKHVFIDGRKVPTDSPEVGTGDWYSSDLFVDWTMRFAAEAKAQNKPFLAYLPFVAVHFPVMAPPEDVAKFKGKYRAGWDTIRAARLARQRATGLLGDEVKLPPREPNTYDWERLSPEDRDYFDTLMATYAADVMRMDQAIGTLVAKLKAMGEYENTLILFMSDNGGNAESGPDGRFTGSGPAGGPQSNIWIGMNWATLANTPFRMYKHYTHEGGIATPLIAHWPAGIAAAQRGTIDRTPTHLVDIMATAIDLGGASYPTQFNGHRIVPMQGVSLAPAFTGAPIRRGKPIFFEHEGNRAVRDGRWKIVADFKKPWELYDMDTDRSELNDLAAAQPARVAAMAKQYDAWAAASFVDPWKDEYDRGMRGHRPNWGGGGGMPPQRPGAIDTMTPQLREQLAHPQPPAPARRRARRARMTPGIQPQGD